MSDTLYEPSPEETLIKELETLKDAKRLLQYITDATNKLNSLMRLLPDEAIRKNNLYWGYSLSSIGNPRIGDPPQALVLANQERRERIVFHSSSMNPFDREHARKVLRSGKMPEPMIWERWPALSNEERADKEARLATYAAKHRPKDYQPPSVTKSPLETFLERQAKTDSRRLNTSQQALLADEAWKENQTAFFKEVMSIDLDI